MTDLALNPEAQIANPAEARRIQQMQAEIARLHPKAKPSTTSYCTTADSSLTTPTRADDDEKRRAEIAAIENPPEDETARRWRLHEEYWAAREAKSKEDERRRQQQIRAEIKAKQQAERREIEQRTHEVLLAEVFERHGATDTERNRVKLLVERSHPAESRTIELYEYTLLRLRDELSGDGNSHADWRPTIGGKR